MHEIATVLVAIGALLAGARILVDLSTGKHEISDRELATPFVHRWFGRRRRGLVLVACGCGIAALVVYSLAVQEEPSVASVLRNLVVSALLILCAIAYMIERSYFRTRSTFLFSALACVLLAADQIDTAPVVALVSILARLLLSQMYLATAIRKLASSPFRSGLAIRNYLVVTLARPSGQILGSSQSRV